MNPVINSIWFDMDGVLALWNRDGLYWLPGYFKNCSPDPYMTRLFQDLTDRYPRKTHIITNLSDQHGRQEHYKSDKKQWITEMFPEFDLQHYHPILNQTKASFAEQYLGRSLGPSDILVSDSNHDLDPWSKTDGICFKYLNGINSPKSFAGNHLHPDTGMTKLLETIARQQRR